MSILGFLAAHPAYAGAETLTWPDPDFLMTGGAGCNDLTPGLRCPGMTDDEYVSEFTLWALAGGQLLVSTDIRDMSPLQARVLLNTEILAVFNDSGKQLGSLVSPSVELLWFEVSVWARELRDVSGSAACVAVALLNGAATETTGPVSVLLDKLGVPGWGNSTTVSVRDLWQHVDLPPATGSVTVPAIASHATAALRLCT